MNFVYKENGRYERIVTDRVESLSQRRGRVERDHVLLNGLNRWRSKTLLRHETGSLWNDTGRLWCKTRRMRKMTSSLRKHASCDRELTWDEMLLVEDRVLCLQCRDSVVNVCHKFHDLVLKHIGIDDREKMITILTTGQVDRKLTSFPESFEFEEEKLF